MSTTTRFEERFRDHPLFRDATVFAFLVLGFALPFRFLFQLVLPGAVSITLAETIGIGLAFAVPWTVLMEYWAYRRDTSIIRSIGTDPLAAQDDRA